MELICEQTSKLEGDVVSFAAWYDIVMRFNESDGLASHHSKLYAMMLAPFLSLERRLRKRIILRRARMARRLEQVDWNSDVSCSQRMHMLGHQIHDERMKESRVTVRMPMSLVERAMS